MSPVGHILPTPLGWERLNLDEPANLRHPRCIPLLSGTEEEADSRLLEVRYRARRPVWTRTMPDREGWWFARPEDSDVGVPVRVQRFEHELRYSFGMHTWTSVSLPGLFWSNTPIEEPGPDGMTWRSAAEKSTRKEPPPASNPRSRPWSPAS